MSEETASLSAMGLYNSCAPCASLDDTERVHACSANTYNLASSRVHRASCVPRCEPFDLLLLCQPSRSLTFRRHSLLTFFAPLLESISRCVIVVELTQPEWAVRGADFGFHAANLVMMCSFGKPKRCRQHGLNGRSIIISCSSCGSFVANLLSHFL